MEKNMNKNNEDKYMRIPRKKISFYKYVKTDRETRELIKLVNYLQKKVK